MDLCSMCCHHHGYIWHEDVQRKLLEQKRLIVKEINAAWVEELSRKDREPGATAIGLNRAVNIIEKL